MTRTDAPAGAQSVLRAIGLLKSFGAARCGLTLQELATRENLNKTTAHRLLAALESEGLVARHPHGNTYHLGPAIIELGSQALLTSDLRTVVRPWLEALAAQSGETATLEVLADESILILDGIAGKHLVSATLGIGSRWPIHACSTGKAILSTMAPDQWQSLVREPLETITPKTVTDLAALQGDILDVRRRGYALAVEEIERDYVAVAAAFYGPQGTAQGALSVGGPSSRFNEARTRELGHLVHQLASDFSTRHERGFALGPTP